MFNIKRNNGTNGSDRGDEKPRKWEFLRLLRGRLIRCLVCDDKDVVGELILI